MWKTGDGPVVFVEMNTTGQPNAFGQKSTLRGKNENHGTNVEL